MENHEYIIHDFYGENRIGIPCHIYQLKDHGKVLYTLNNVLLEDGSEHPEPIKLFYDRAEAIMDDMSEEGTKA